MQELFLPKEWLIKVNAHTSTPYLIICAFAHVHSITLDPRPLGRNFILHQWISPAASWSLTPSGRGLKASPPSSAISQANSIPRRPPVLSSNPFARGWRECNNRIDLPPLNNEQQEAWRTHSLKLLSTAHTLGCMVELSFEVIESKFGVQFP